MVNSLHNRPTVDLLIDGLDSPDSFARGDRNPAEWPMERNNQMANSGIHWLGVGKSSLTAC